MATALVRMQSNKELVGIFAYPNKKILFDWVDECVSPFDTEYIVLDVGGLYFPSSVGSVMSSDEIKETTSYKMGVAYAKHFHGVVSSDADLDGYDYYYGNNEEFKNGHLNEIVYRQLDNKKWHTFTRKDLWGEDYE